MYNPAELVTVRCVTPVAGLSRITLAPGTMSPPGSVTVPLILPLPASWPNAATAVKSIAKTTHQHEAHAPLRMNVLRIMSPPLLLTFRAKSRKLMAVCDRANHQ